MRKTEICHISTYKGNCPSSNYLERCFNAIASLWLVAVAVWQGYFMGLIGIACLSRLYVDVDRGSMRHAHGSKF